MESAASSPNVAAADIENPTTILFQQQQRRPNSTVINNLFSIAACSSKVDEIKLCQKELQKNKQIIDENFMFQRKCHQMAYDLEAERKSHAEELRQINQDINHLEDMMKRIKSSHEQQKNILRQKYAVFRSELFITNQLCLDCGLTNENLIPFDSISIPEWLIDKRISNLMIPSSSASAAAAMTGSSLHPFLSSSQIPSTFRSPFSNYFFPPPQQKQHQQHHSSSSSSSSIRNLHPRPFGTFLEDISKLKDCQSCQQKIHRNAPICPLCKSKNSSKAKKQRKNL